MVLGVPYLPNVNYLLVARFWNAPISNGSEWDTSIRQGILIATDRSNADDAAVWLVAGSGHISKIYAGGANNDVGTSTYPLIWSGSTLRIKSASSSGNTITAMAIGYKY